MFNIFEETYCGYSSVTLKNSITKESLTVIPSLGGNIQSIKLFYSDKLIEILDGHKKRSDFEYKGIFNGAKLIPFANRLRDGIYEYEGITYKLPLNYIEENNASHGLVYDKKMIIKKKIVNDSYAEVILEYHYKNDQPGYPFDLLINQSYKINSNSEVEFSTTVKNKSIVSIPFADGWHPFIKLNCPPNRARISINAIKKNLVDEQRIPIKSIDENIEYYKDVRYEDEEFDDCFKIRGNEDNIHHTYISVENEFQIDIWQETGINKYNYLQLYTPPSKTSIAVEPMTCNIDAFNNKEGLIHLKPKESFHATFGIRLLAIKNN